MDERIKKLISNPLIMVIDMQNVYSKGQKWECKNFDRVLESLKNLFECTKGEDFLFTRYIASNTPMGIWKDYNEENAEVNEDAWANDIVEDLGQYVDKYRVIDKSVYSSLESDEVKMIVEGFSCVVVTGVVAECCVLSTVMSLIDAGIYVIYLKDAIAGMNGETENVTIKVLEGLMPLHLSIMDTREYMDLKDEFDYESIVILNEENSDGENDNYFNARLRELDPEIQKYFRNKEGLNTKNFNSVVLLDMILELKNMKEQKLILMRLGIVTGQLETRQKVADKYNITVERVREIELNFLRMYQDKKTKKKLRSLLE